jgi:hypothetical protein
LWSKLISKLRAVLKQMDCRIFTADTNKVLQLIQWFIHLWVHTFRHLTHGSACHGDRTYRFTCCNSSNQLKLRHFRSCWHWEQAQRHYNKNTNTKWDEVKAIIDVGAAYHTERRVASVAKRVISVLRLPVRTNTCSRPARYARLTCPPVYTHTCPLPIRISIPSWMYVASVNFLKLLLFLMTPSIKISFPIFETQIFLSLCLVSKWSIADVAMEYNASVFMVKWLSYVSANEYESSYFNWALCKRWKWKYPVPPKRRQRCPYSYSPRTQENKGIKSEPAWKYTVNNRTRSLFHVCIFLLAFCIELHLLQFLLINIPYLHGLSPRANYTDRATTACRQNGFQLLRIESATWSTWRISTAVFSVF